MGLGDVGCGEYFCDVFGWMFVVRKFFGFVGFVSVFLVFFFFFFLFWRF